MATKRDDLLKKKCTVDLHVSQSKVELAIKAYKVDTGTYPNSLNELVPKYLSSIPIDPYSNPESPLQYDPATKTITSIGKDLDKVWYLATSTLKIKF